MRVSSFELVLPHCLCCPAVAIAAALVSIAAVACVVMPSWHDGSSSGTTDVLWDITDLDLAPDTVEDPTFCGIALDSTEVCRAHKLKPRRCVAFQGCNTVRRFYLCSHLNQVENCGFVSWVDGEWPETAQNALGTLWAMYSECKRARMEENYENAQVINDLTEEKKKIEKQYSTLLQDVNKVMHDTHRKVMQENYVEIMKEGTDDDKQDKVVALEKKVEALEKEIGELKQVQGSQAAVMKSKQAEWDAEKVDMKEEKKKLEFTIYEMFNANQANKDKLKKIRELFDE